MALLLKCGAVFLHIPKTGGIWVREALKTCDLVQGEVGNMHADLDRVIYYQGFLSGREWLIQKLRDKFLSSQRRKGNGLNPFVFCFVRNPVKWYESFWRFMTFMEWRGRDPGDWYPGVDIADIQDSDFNQFVRRVNVRCPGYVTDLFSRYTGTGVRFIGKQESLVDDLVRVLNVLNVSFNEDQLRAVTPRNVGDVHRGVEAPLVWDPSLKMEIERQEYAGMVRYGYQSGSGANKSEGA